MPYLETRGVRWDWDPVGRNKNIYFHAGASEQSEMKLMGQRKAVFCNMNAQQPCSTRIRLAP